jgi:3D (Asp-Asp-Asp) domain-containing protein
MKLKIRRLVMSMIIAIIVFATMFVGCGNESETFVEPTETIKIEVEYGIEETVEPTETIEVEEIVEETEPVEETKPKEVVEKPKQEQNNKDDSNKETEESKQEESNLVYMGRFKLTAYCACSKCCGKSDGITASGTKAKQGRTIAVDPKQIPYGTKVVINGHTYVAEDCGGSIKNNRIDVFFNSHKEALQFGVQYADVYIIKD